MDWEKIGIELQNREPGLMDASGRYAVLVPLIERDGELYVLYEVRAATMRRQPGEVCFPGGHIEPGETPETCALRETWEELGIPEESVKVLGRLDFIAHRANFIMYPILGMVEAGALERMNPNPDEVGETFLVPEGGRNLPGAGVSPAEQSAPGVHLFSHSHHTGKFPL